MASTSQPDLKPETMQRIKAVLLAGGFRDDREEVVKKLESELDFLMAKWNVRVNGIPRPGTRNL